MSGPRTDDDRDYWVENPDEARTLFDPAPYGEGRALRRKPASGPGAPNATYDSSWIVVGRKSLRPDGLFHRVRAKMLSEGGQDLGGIITRCGQVGRPIHVDDSLAPGTPIVACEKCLPRKEGQP